MKIKKIACLIMLVVMIFSLTACGDDSKVEAGNNNSKEAGTVEQTYEITESEETEKNDNLFYDHDWNFAEQEILNKYDISVVATPIDYNHENNVAARWILKVTNKAYGAKTIGIDAFAINGIAMDSYAENIIYCYYNEQTEVEITIRKDESELNNITDIQSLGVQISVFKDSEFVGRTKYAVVKTEGSENYVQKCVQSSDIVYNENNIKITKEGIEKTDSGNKYLRFCVENKNSFSTFVKLDCISINQKDHSKNCKQLLYFPPNCKGNIRLKVSSALSEIEEESVKEIELKIIYESIDDPDECSDEKYITLTYQKE